MNVCWRRRKEEIEWEVLRGGGRKGLKRTKGRGRGTLAWDESRKAGSGLVCVVCVLGLFLFLAREGGYYFGQFSNIRKNENRIK